jgi:hypothetical protein
VDNWEEYRYHFLVGRNNHPSFEYQEGSVDVGGEQKQQQQQQQHRSKNSATSTKSTAVPVEVQ